MQHPQECFGREYDVHCHIQFHLAQTDEQQYCDTLLDGWIMSKCPRAIQELKALTATLSEPMKKNVYFSKTIDISYLDYFLSGQIGYIVVKNDLTEHRNDDLRNTQISSSSGKNPSSRGNQDTSSGNALAFYSQQSSPKLDSSSA
ncbi:hypothetical protein Tco_0733150 [Tanacetum coccineum]